MRQRLFLGRIREWRRRATLLLLSATEAMGRCRSMERRPLCPPLLMALMTELLRWRSISCTARMRSTSVRSCSGTAAPASNRATKSCTERDNASYLQALPVDARSKA